MGPSRLDVEGRQWTICRTADSESLSNIWLVCPADIRSVQRVMKNALAASASASDDEASFTDLKEAYAAEKLELQELLAASEEKLTYAEHRIQKKEHNESTLDDSATKVDEA